MASYGALSSDVFVKEILICISVRVMTSFGNNLLL